MIGQVVGDVKYDNNRSEFVIQSKETNDDQEYIVISYGIKALMDYIFIRPGQTVYVEGQKDDSIIYRTKSKILLSVSD